MTHPTPVKGKLDRDKGSGDYTYTCPDGKELRLEWARPRQYRGGLALSAVSGRYMFIPKEDLPAVIAALQDVVEDKCTSCGGTGEKPGRELSER
jgi:hypothetical protein